MSETNGNTPGSDSGAEPGPLATAPAESLELSLAAGGPSLGSHRVIDFAATATAIDGTEPFVWNSSAERSRDTTTDPIRSLAQLLPAGSEVTRTTERRYGARVLARADGFHVYLEESQSRLEVTVTAATPDLARSVGTAILGRVPSPSMETSHVSFRVWHRGRERVEWTTKNVHVPTWPEVERNYPPASRVELDRLMNLGERDEASTSGRLIVWHGAPGTGKTTAIRALVHSWSAWCAPELLMDPEAAFEDPSYLSDVIAYADNAYEDPTASRPWRLLIAEDADRYVRADARSRDNAGLDRLLNLADGILGQGTRLLILLTTNSELSTVHPALVRPGRCLALTEFRRFSAAEAREWLDEAALVPAGGETIAELYALRSGLGQVAAIRERVLGQYL